MEFAVLGLGEAEERTYQALVASPHTTAAELAADMGTSTPVTAHLLAVLVAKHLATRNGRPARYLAAPPDVTLARLIQERDQDLSAARAKVNALTELHRNANNVSGPELGMELLTDRAAIGAAARLLTFEARDQVRALDRPPYVDRPGSHLEEQLDRMRQGVAYRVVYSRAATEWPHRLKDDILPAREGGERARVRPELPIKLVIRDDQDALIPFNLGPGGQQLAVLVRRSPVLTALEALFEAEWDRAVAIDQGGAASDARPREEADEITRSLLALLTTGMSDTAIARAQGWSLRTTHRRLRRLMAQLGATTRFQAGLIAGRRGLI
ncbi:helix-turn-helix domain-containing protein [Streptomyces sp. NPDC047002]|uniref:TrmB family transcriptional regulator n=1 Tax=Streptomyces sp. NPDC047002 TaxID=3155475 RepID=UPI00345215D9